MLSISNPHEFTVLAGLRNDAKGRNLLVLPKQTAATAVSTGTYEVYFVYATQPTALFKGDDVSLGGLTKGVTITLNTVVGGNYHIKQIK